MAFKAGLVAVVGRPNVGKSTLVNAVVGQKVSIVSDKAQTTRRNALGIATTPDWQIVFVDSPGFHKPHHRLGQSLLRAAQGSLTDVDVVLAVVDAGREPKPEDRIVADAVEQNAPKAARVLALNKMDLLKPEHVQRRYDAFNELFKPEATVMTSFLKMHNVDLLVGEVVARLPEGERMYPEESFTDQPARRMVEEIVREQALRRTREEVPHSIAVQVEEWDEQGPGMTRISCVLLVETPGQKGIMIGAKGAMLKAIGTDARKQIEALLDTKVYLELFVKMREGWRQNAGILKDLDLL